MFGQVSESLSRSQWRLRIFWYRNIIGYDGGFTLERLRDWGEGLFVWTVSPYTGYQEGNPESGRRGGKLAALALPVLLACLAAGGLYLRFRRRRGQEGLTLTEAQRRARILLDRVSRQLRRQGINCEQRTAGELALAARGKPNVRAEHAHSGEDGSAAEQQGDGIGAPQRDGNVFFAVGVEIVRAQSTGHAGFSARFERVQGL